MIQSPRPEDRCDLAILQVLGLDKIATMLAQWPHACPAQQLVTIKRASFIGVMYFGLQDSHGSSISILSCGLLQYDGALVSSPSVSEGEDDLSLNKKPASLLRGKREYSNAPF